MKLCLPLSVIKNNSAPTAVQSGFFALSSFIKPNMQSKKCLQLTALLVMGSLLSACGSDSSSSIPDTTAPVVTLSGNDSVELGQGRDYLEYGASVTDNVDEALDFDIEIFADESNICSDITWNDSEDDNYSEDCVGDIFTVSYSATDSAGNISDTVERTITIVEARPFIFTYQTTEDGEEFTPYIEAGFSYDFTIDWGDGTTDENVSEEITHIYTTAGIYTISISGSLPLFSVYSTEKANYLSIEQWGDIKWEDLNYAFSGAENIVDNASDTPDLRLVETLINVFFNATSFNGDLSLWQVGHITEMSSLFYGAESFNSDISQWDVSSVINFFQTFRGAASFNQDISGWNTSSATSFSNMFHSANSFNQDISGWDTSSVARFNNMFIYALAFNQDISGWDTSSGSDFSRMLSNAKSFDQNLSSWNMSAAEDISYMFYSAQLSSENYDALLNSFATQDVVAGLEFHGGCSESSSDSDDAVTTLTIDKSWLIEYNSDEECEEWFGEE